MVASSSQVTRLPIDTPQFFFDDELISHQQRLVRRWLPATIYPWPVIEPDRPWEGRSIGLHGPILPDVDGRYRLYYTSGDPGHKGRALVNVATSGDGLTWEKPELGLIESRGSRVNNAALASQSAFGLTGVLHEPDDARYPYKLMAFRNEKIPPLPDPNWGLWVYRSEDGLRWPDPPQWCLPTGDRSTMMTTKPGGKYVVYTRKRGTMDSTGGRAVWRTTSEDFREWSELELVLAADLTDEPDVEFYGMNVFERHGWFIGLAEHWRSDHDVKEVHLAWSRDGRSWHRPLPRTPFIGATYDWNRASSNCATNGPIILNEQMVFYIGGSLVGHNRDSARRHGVIGYASLPLDRFCALEGTSGGQLTTTPLEWPGGDLVVNVDTRESFSSHPTQTTGELGVEVLDAAGGPLDGWSGDDRAKFSGNTHCRGQVFPGTVRWTRDGEERSLGMLRGQTVRLRFHLRHARLFTFAAGRQKAG